MSRSSSRRTGTFTSTTSYEVSESASIALSSTDDSPVPTTWCRTMDPIGFAGARLDHDIAIDVFIVPSGDLVTPMVEALRDPEVAIVGAVGLVSADLRRFEERSRPRTCPSRSPRSRADLMAFSFEPDPRLRGPIDEELSLRSTSSTSGSASTLRDEGEGRAPRRAVAFAGPAIQPGPSRRAPAAGGRAETRPALEDPVETRSSARTHSERASTSRPPEPLVRSGHGSARLGPTVGPDASLSPSGPRGAALDPPAMRSAKALPIPSGLLHSDRVM